MPRATRSYRLALSPAGMDLLIDAHVGVVRATRQVLPWGASLHVAVRHLSSLPTERAAEAILQIRSAGLAGAEEHFLGAPFNLLDITTAMAERLREHCSPLLGEIYIAALRETAVASPAQLRQAYEFIHDGHH